MEHVQMQVIDIIQQQLQIQEQSVQIMKIQQVEITHTQVMVMDQITVMQHIQINVNTLGFSKNMSREVKN